MPVPSPSHHVRASDARRVRDLLRIAVAGRARTGDLLPGEDELMVGHGVPRSAVRAALGLLREEGLLRPGPTAHRIVARPHYPGRTAVAGTGTRVPRWLERTGIAAPDELADWLGVPVGTPCLRTECVSATAGGGAVLETHYLATEAAALLHEINLGATAIGTGLNAAPGYAEAACAHLGEITGVPVRTAADLVEATQDCGAFVHLSGVLKRIAVKLSKSCNDLRLLSSGPRAGLNEIDLPPVQAGSSIMPGKINPVIPEVVNQVAFEVIGNDVAVTMAAEAGQLQLNAFEPIILHSLSESITHLGAACRTLATRCVAGITANTDVLRGYVENSIGLVTALNPTIGYAAATEIAKEALASGRGVVELVVERGLIPADELARLLRPEVLARPGLR